MNAKQRAILKRLQRLEDATDMAIIRSRLLSLTRSEREIYQHWCSEWKGWHRAYDTDTEAYAALVKGDIHNPEPDDLPDAIVEKVFGYDPKQYRIMVSDIVEQAANKYRAFCDQC